MSRTLTVLFWLIVGVVGLPLVGAVIYTVILTVTGSPVDREANAGVDLATATPSGLQPSGEIADIFSFFSNATALQRDEMEKQIKGRIVQWRLKVYDVSKSGDSYRIQTSGGAEVNTFCYIKPNGDGERRYLAGLKTGDAIVCKGRVEGVSMRSIVIRPAMLAISR